MDSNIPLFLRHIAQTSDAPLLLEIDSANGVYLTDTLGRQYMDLISGISVSNLGHSHPEVVKAVCEQAARHMHLMVYGEYVQSPQVKLAQLLTSLLPSSLSQVYFVNSGAEAVEGALKLAKRYTGRSGIVSFKNAYHGSSHGALSVTGGEWLKQPYRPLLPEIQLLTYGQAVELEAITDKTACVIIEPVQGEGGVIVPPEDYLQELRNRCNETGALLIFDEIQTGFGRTGKLFAFEHAGVTPDILLLAKALGGGMPLGAFVSSADIMPVLTHNPPLGHITTFGGHPVSCAAGYAALKVLTSERLWEKAEEKERLFRKLLNHPDILEIRSRGLIMAAELGNPDRVKAVIRKCVENGVITDWFLFRETALRIAPPLIISESEIRKACEVITRAMDDTK